MRDDGTAKTSYPTREAAAHYANMMWARTGRPYNPYRCGQRPEHWHVGRGIPDVKERQ